MDFTAFPPIAAVLNGLSAVVTGIGEGIEPFVGSAAPVLAIALLTVAVRLLLLPVARSQVKAELTRRRLAPTVAAIRKRHAERPEVMNRELMDLYAREKASPMAGCLPTLAQAPVLSAVYALFLHPQLSGHANVLLTQTFAGVPLGSNLFAAIGSSIVHVWVFIVLLAVLATAVELTRRANLRWAGSALTSEAQIVPGMATMMRVLPFATVVFAAIAPLAAAVYLVTSAVWTFVERAVLRRVLSRRAAASGPAAGDALTA